MTREEFIAQIAQDPDIIGALREGLSNTELFRDGSEVLGKTTEGQVEYWVDIIIKYIGNWDHSLLIHNGYPEEFVDLYINKLKNILALIATVNQLYEVLQTDLAIPGGQVDTALKVKSNMRDIYIQLINAEKHKVLKCEIAYTGSAKNPIPDEVDAINSHDIMVLFYVNHETLKVSYTTINYLYQLIAREATDCEDK